MDDQEKAPETEEEQADCAEIVTKKRAQELQDVRRDGKDHRGIDPRIARPQ